MKKILFCAVAVLSVSSNIYAQTKQKQNYNKPKPTLEETLTWMVEKFNSYSMDYQNEPEISEYRFSISDNGQFIIVHYLYSSTHSNETPHRTASIPVRQIKSIVKSTDILKSHVLEIQTYGKDIINFNQSTDTYSFGFNWDKEENIKARLQTALTDLQSNFPKKQEIY